MSELIGYKAVREDIDGRYWSATLMGYPVEYKLGETSLPKEGCGPLAIFDTLDDAKKFICYDLRGICFILKSKYIPSKETKMWTTYNPSGVSILISGTILADSVTPLEIVE